MESTKINQEAVNSEKRKGSNEEEEKKDVENDNESSTISKIIKTLQADNIKILHEILNRDPNQKYPRETETLSNEEEISLSKDLKSKIKQRVYFGDESIRDIVIRYLLNDPFETWNNNMYYRVNAANNNNTKESPVLNEKKEFQEYPLPNTIQKASLLSDLLSSKSSSSINKKESLHEEIKQINENNINVLVFFLRPNVQQTEVLTTCMKFFLSQLKKKKAPTNSSLVYRIVYLPHCNSLCERILLDNGILNASSASNLLSSSSAQQQQVVITLEEIPIDLIPIDEDVFSMEYSSLFKESHLLQNKAPMITSVAQSIAKLQIMAGGLIPRLQGLGPLSQDILNQLMLYRLQQYQEELQSTNTSVDDAACEYGSITGLLLIDRKVDMVTPMVMPLTYEALVDEIIGLTMNFVKVDSSILVQKKDDQSTSTTTPTLENTKSSLVLNSKDELFQKVRIQNVEKFGSYLQDEAKLLKESHSKFSKRDADLNQIHAFVKQIPAFTQNLKSLTLHIHLAEQVKKVTDERMFNHQWHTQRSMIEGEVCLDALEDYIAYNETELYTILRLFCLQSLTGGGIKAAKFDSLRREIIQTFGLELLPLLQHLEQVGFLRRREMTWTSTVSDSTSFRKLRELLILVNADVSPIEPKDFSYVSSGYAPLTVRLIQAASQGWGGKEEALRELPGRLIDIVQEEQPDTLEQAMNRCHGLLNSVKLGNNLKNITPTQNEKPLVFVYYVGGVTYMEIAAIRFLNQRKAFPFHIVCCTTKIINGTSLIKSLM